MPHHKSAIKRIRTAKRDRIRNTSIKSEIKSLLKKAQETPADKEVARLTVSKLDRAVRKGVIPKAVANRRKSRLALMINRAGKKAS
ncbi:MAG TPA: 30S ribosomal protein S20 [Candidatus Dormibacteraeota bacterium]|nr:30S ribosomal protein S20 [Candidatus Dormibacteraeota bacterium]